MSPPDRTADWSRLIARLGVLFQAHRRTARPPPEVGRARQRRPVLLGVLGVVVLTIIALPLLVLERSPTVPSGALGANEYLSVTRGLFHQTLATGTAPGSRKVMILNANDIEAVANFFLARKHLMGNARCLITRRRMNLEASIALPLLRMPWYLNLRLIADDGDPQAILKKVTIGRLSLPDPVVGWLAKRLLHSTSMDRYGQLGEQLLQEVRIRDGVLVLSLNWNRNVLSKAQGMLLDLADKERLLIYHEQLVELVGQPELKRFIRLSRLLQPMFALAATRSAAGNDPVAENRAVIVVLGAYVNGRSLAAALPAPEEPVRLGVLLNKRIDTAQHFMGSAAMTLTGNTTLVQMLGLAKEMNDTHDGSGFSFNDLAADQAGIAFGKLAVSSDANARRVQRVLIRNAEESIFMPATKDLAENLSPQEFAARFKDIYSPEFAAVKDLIDQRIRALPLFQMN